MVIKAAELEPDQVERNIKRLLRETDRKGIEELIQHLDKVQFFSQPASTKFHGAFPGGLAAHSLQVFFLYEEQARELESVNKSLDTIAITTLLHDLCKSGAYIPIKGPLIYKWNKKHPEGHGRLSAFIVKHFIELTNEEEAMIRYHMGFWYSIQSNDKKGEYPLSKINEVFNKVPSAKLLHLCDEISSLMGV